MLPIATRVRTIQYPRRPTRRSAAIRVQRERIATLLNTPVSRIAFQAVDWRMGTASSAQLVSLDALVPIHVKIAQQGRCSLSQDSRGASTVWVEAMQPSMVPLNPVPRAGMSQA